MNIKRLYDIENHLELLREQQAGLEKEALLANGLLKIQVSQRLEKEVKPAIKKYEEEYWLILSQQSESLEISEKDAEVVVAEMVGQVSEIEVSSTFHSDEIIRLLKEIQNKLNEADKTAAAKLKGVISTIPPFVGISYEGEIDTENFLRIHFPSFIDLFKKSIKKKHPL